MTQNFEPNVMAIRSGSFSKGKGNFWGQDLLGKGIFIHKNLMKGKGWTKDEEVKFPFFVVLTEVDITPWDDAGKPIIDEATGKPKKEKRTQAASIFSSKEEIKEAFVESTSLATEIKVEVTKSYKAILSNAGIETLEALA